MRFIVRNHQNKSVPYRDALLNAGHVDAEDNLDAVLIDFGIPHPAYDPWVQAARENDAALIVYPHGGEMVYAWELTGKPVDRAAMLVSGPGQEEILSLHDYPFPIHVIGWPGEVKPLEPCKPERVLFAPLHPLGSGYQSPMDAKLNADAYKVLLEEPFDLTVRHIGTLEQNGLWREKGVRYIPGRMDGTLDKADVIVSHGTYALNALRAGIPTVMFAHDHYCHYGEDDQPNVTWVEGWEDIAEMIEYPFELKPGACAEAAANPQAAQDWCDRFLGPEFDPKAFATLIEEIA